MSTLSDAALASPHRSAAETSADREVHPAYRPDIDGLRAVAVLAVVVFHFFPSALPGGFVGVDIFFVISGYLISQILLGSLAQEGFSLAAFYGRRIRRLFPALLLVMTAVLAFGWTALFRAEYLQLGEHAVAGAAFLANFVLWSESGYFDKAAIAKPLLHLWSLGVEEQFYIFWPLVLAVAWRMRWNLLLVTGTIALLSFGANVVATAEAPAAAFYSPFTRFWELMLGAMLACRAMQRAGAAGVSSRGASLADRPQLASLVSGVGGLLIVLGTTCATEKDFPGWQALLPTLGAALVISAGPQGALNRVLLSRGLFVAIGFISYPLYLWHWPLLSFSRIVHGELGVGMRVALLVLAVVLAALTHLLVERPVKAMRRRSAVTLALAVLMTGVAGAGLMVVANAGIGQRAVAHANDSLEEARISPYPPVTASCPFIRGDQAHLLQCHVDRRAPPRFALLGDSKAHALFPGLFRTAAPEGTWMFLGSGKDSRLVPVLSDSPIYAYVDRRAVELALRTIEGTKSVETVVIATATRALFDLANEHSIADLPGSRNGPAALAGLDATVARLVAAGKRVVLLVDNPTLPHMEDCVSRKTGSSFFNALLAAPPNPRCEITVARQLELSRPYRDLLEEIRRRHPDRVSLFDSLSVLCDGATSLCAPKRAGQFLYGRTDHISHHASLLLGEALNRQLQAERASVASPLN